MESHNSGTTILVIDDTPTNLEVLYGALSGAGYEILVEMDGESGIEQARNNLPELILLDVMMPGIDGFETCRRLKSNPITHDIPVIFMTALAETASKVQGLNAGAVDYITKPFQHEEVLARVKIHLQLRSMTRTLAEQNSLLKNFSTYLEEKIAERTQELQLAHVQLIQQEKLSSLGQLVAGIAHEINNPVNFIYGNCSPAKRYAQDLLELVSLYQAEFPQSSLKLQEKINDIDLEFLERDFPKIISSMQMGSERIREIVLSLRNFSRLDEADFKEVDIHDGIDNTLMILHHRLKANSDSPEIQVIKKYGQIPLVCCFPGQLNQVFMNLIGNAIDALQEYNETRSVEEQKMNPSKIWIQTQPAHSGWVSIQISDNGSGIPDGVRSKLFDPFFTTKPVGKGTGLGLSISHQIVVEKHQGKIWCDPASGQGAKFIIEVPLEQQNMPS
jgi:two-component system, NtrC family, sensor kinase